MNFSAVCKWLLTFSCNAYSTAHLSQCKWRYLNIVAGDELFKNQRVRDRQEVKARHQQISGSFRAQQIGGDYLSLIRCTVDSRFIDSCTAWHSSVKNQTRGGAGVNSRMTEAKEGIHNHRNCVWVMLSACQAGVLITIHTCFNLHVCFHSQGPVKTHTWGRAGRRCEAGDSCVLTHFQRVWCQEPGSDVVTVLGLDASQAASSPCYWCARWSWGRGWVG